MKIGYNLGYEMGNSMKKILLTVLKPTGSLTLGKVKFEKMKKNIGLYR